MVQIFDLSPTPSSASMIGQALGQGINKNFPDPQQLVQRGMLQEAFNKLQPGQNFIEQLKTIAPQLLTTSGGAQALSELAPILGTASKNEAWMKLYNDRKAAQQGNQKSTAGQPFANGQSQKPTPENKFLQEQDPSSAESLFPERSTGTQAYPEMSPAETEQFAVDLMMNSNATGNPIDYATALQNAIAINQNNIAANQRIQQQKQLTEQAYAKRNEGILNRAENSGLLKSPEDRTVAEKLANKSKDAATPTDQWEYVRTGLRKFDAARSAIKRNYEVPGPIETTYNKLLGTYKDKEQAIKDMQPSLNVYREEGLFDEARQLLTNDVGLGAEDTELALFPFKQNQINDLNSIGKNVFYKVNPSKSQLQQDFPGDESSLNEISFDAFKEDLRDYFSKKENKDTNLLGLRGYLNTNLKYSWQDIYKAVDELISEKSFVPNIEQDKQLKIIREAPLPGFAQRFKYLITGTK